MIVTEAVAAVRLKILERSNDAGLVTDAEVKSFIYEANRRVWNKAALQNGAQFMSRGADVTFPTTNTLPLSTLTGASADGDVVEVSFLEVKASDGRYYAMWPVASGPSDRFLAEPGVSPLNAIDPGAQFEWYLEGQSIRLTPPPTRALTLRAVWIQKLAQPADAAELLGGRFPMQHDLVVTMAAVLCYHRDGVKETPWDAEVEDLLGDMIVAVKRGGQGQRSRRVTPRDPFNA